MTQQSHSWAYIQTKLSLKKTHAPALRLSSQPCPLQMGSLILLSQFVCFSCFWKQLGFLGLLCRGSRLAGSCPLQGKVGARVGTCQTSIQREHRCGIVSPATQGWSFSAVIMVWLAPQIGRDGATVWALQDQITQPWRPASEGPGLSPRAGGVQARERYRDRETDGQRETWTEDVVAEEVLFCDSVPLQCDLWWDLH